MAFSKFKLAQQFLLYTGFATLFILISALYYINFQEDRSALLKCRKQLASLEQRFSKLEELAAMELQRNSPNGRWLQEHIELTGYAMENFRKNLSESDGYELFAQDLGKLWLGWESIYKGLKYHRATGQQQATATVRNEMHYLKQQLLKLDLRIESAAQKHTYESRIFLIVVMAFFLVYFWFGFWYLHRSLLIPMRELTTFLRKMANGETVEKLPSTRQDELGQLTSSMNLLIENFDSLSHFAQKVGKGEFNSQLVLRSEDDTLGQALLTMQQNINKFVHEDEKQLWLSNGVAGLSNILSNYNDDWQKLCYQVISFMVNYLKANQGGVFLLNNHEAETPFLELTAAYAYHKKKYLEKKIPLQQGLIGQCFKEAKTIKLHSLPQDYTLITSGLGESTPSELLLLPLKMNDRKVGVIEVASFKPFEEHQVAFAEKACENIATTFISLENNQKTKKLLEDANSHAQRMKAQEELLRQNLEQLAKAQEGLQRNQKATEQREKNMRAIVNGTQHYICALEPNGKLLFLNEQFTHWPLAQDLLPAKGVDFEKLFPNYKRKKIKELLMLANQGKQVQKTENFLANEQEFYLTISMSAIKKNKGETEAIAIFMGDVTEINPIRQ